MLSLSAALSQSFQQFCHSCVIVFIFPNDKNEVSQTEDSCVRRSQDWGPRPESPRLCFTCTHRALALVSPWAYGLWVNTLSPLCPQRTMKITSPPTSRDRHLLSWRRSGNPRPRGTVPTTVGLSQGEAQGTHGGLPHAPPSPTRVVPFCPSCPPPVPPMMTDDHAQQFPKHFHT